MLRITTLIIGFLSLSITALSAQAKTTRLIINNKTNIYFNYKELPSEVKPFSWVQPGRNIYLVRAPVVIRLTHGSDIRGSIIVSNAIVDPCYGLAPYRFTKCQFHANSAEVTIEAPIKHH